MEMVTGPRFRNSGDLEHVFRALIESSPIGAYLVQDQKFLYVNRALAEMLGYEPDELVGRLGPLDVVHPDDRALVAEKMQERLEGKAEAAQYVVRGIRKDGGIVHVEVFGRRIDFGGRPALFGTVVDVTEKLKLIESLRESEGLFRAILDAAPDAIVTMKPNAEIVGWSKGAEKIFGYSADEARGRPLGIIMPPESRGRFAAEFSRALQTGEYKHMGHLRELTCMRKDGSRFPAEISVSRWDAKDGPRFVGVVRDITERKEALWWWRQFLQKLVKTLSTAFQVRDPYTGRHQLRVAELCKAIAEELGLSPERIEGIYIGALLHDVGKLAVPAEILSKPAKLTSVERSLVEQHPLVGYEILKEVEFPWPVAEMALQHHERLDGSGYPKGLTGDEITLEARILAVADVVESMSSHRPYRAAIGIEAALREIEAGKGTLYDPRVVDACLRLFREKDFRFQTQYEL
ncbi:PAS domain S-box protein [Candidatus Bipolaricaulota sp. J31]